LRVPNQLYEKRGRSTPERNTTGGGWGVKKYMRPIKEKRKNKGQSVRLQLKSILAVGERRFLSAESNTETQTVRKKIRLGVRHREKSKHGLEFVQRAEQWVVWKPA